MIFRENHFALAAVEAAAERPEGRARRGLELT